jgi:hypothetical protein
LCAKVFQIPKYYAYKKFIQASLLVSYPSRNIKKVILT